MLKFICLLLTIVSWTAGYIIDETTLVSTFMILRHGDRTPVKKTIPLCTNPEACLAASEPFGLGQLTDIGKRRSYALGQSIRRRYNALLSPQYNASEIYIRSTDTTRTKMTILVAMAAVYPAYEGSWSENINWVPVPYTTVPELYDYNRATVNCPKIIAEIAAKKKTNQPRMNKYAEVLKYIAEVSNNSLLVRYPMEAYGVYDAYISQVSLGVELDPRIAAAMDDLGAAAGEAMDIRFGDDSSVKLHEGVLLNDFFKNANLTIKGIDTPKVRIISAHDGSEYSFMAVSQIKRRQGVPKYASNFALELRKIDGTDQYGVLAVYEPSPGEDLVYLRIKGCKTLICPIDTFKSIVSKYLLDEDTWRDLCGWTKDLVIDETS